MTLLLWILSCFFFVCLFNTSCWLGSFLIGAKYESKNKYIVAKLYVNEENYYCLCISLKFYNFVLFILLFLRSFASCWLGVSCS